MESRLIVALVRDYYLGGADLGGFARAYECKYKRVDNHSDLIKALRSSRPVLVVVDLACDVGDLREVASQAQNGTHLVAFGPAHDEGLRREAKAAGFHEAMPNIEFHRTVPDVLARHIPPPPEKSGLDRLLDRFRA